jgi:choline dehydrogenase
MPNEDAFDYVIIGAGSAGCVLANRLSADPNLRILLLEAGPRDRQPLVHLPFATAKLWPDPRLVWGFDTEPQAELGGRRLPVPRGKLLGGTSSINGMMAIRGHARDYDAWRDQGLPGWGFDDVLPYFKRLESDWRGSGPFHGGDGPVAISRHPAPSPMLERAQEAARAMGFPLTDDFNGAQTEGFGLPDFTVRRGRRASAAAAYLRPAIKRANLTVHVNAQAERITFDDGRATGVSYRHDGNDRHVQAKREVILSGGAINSPQLLMLSGIGPGEELRRLGLPVHIDRPAVGANLQDHPGAGMEFALNPDWGFDRNLRFDRMVAAALRWVLTGGGPFGAPPMVISANLATAADPSLVDLHFLLIPLAMDSRVWFPGIRKPRGPVMGAMWSLNYPRSRGHLSLRSADPRAAPRIQYNLLQDPFDQTEMVRGYKLLRKLMSQPPLAELLGPMLRPAPEPTSDTAILDYIRSAAATAFHPAGTCRMGADEEAVVDASLRVRGVAGLRVVDASIFPSLPGGNTNLPVMMVAEKAADMILDGVVG